MKEFDYAVEYSKTFINLAALLLGLSLTFATSITSKDPLVLLILLCAWISWIISIYLGADSIAKIAVLAAGEEEGEPTEGPFDRSVTTRLRWQRSAFLAGFVIAAVSALVGPLLAVLQPAA